MTGDARIPSAYLEHVAIVVRDIGWHADFFADALGTRMREVDGDPDDPRQHWTIGGFQFISDPDHDDAARMLAIHPRTS